MKRRRFIPTVDFLPSRIAPTTFAPPDSPPPGEDDPMYPPYDPGGDTGEEEGGFCTLDSDPPGHDPMYPSGPFG